MIISEVAPTDNVRNNPVYEYTYDDDGNLTQIDMTFSGRTYRKTFTWDEDDLTDETAWSKV